MKEEGEHLKAERYSEMQLYNSTQGRVKTVINLYINQSHLEETSKNFRSLTS